VLPKGAALVSDPETLIIAVSGAAGAGEEDEAEESAAE